MDAIITCPEWHTKDERPVYDPEKDNRIILCSNYLGWKNVCYDDLRPDGTLISCADCFHNEKWKKKHAIKWEHVIINYWAWVRDIVPIKI